MHQIKKQAKETNKVETDVKESVPQHSIRYSIVFHLFPGLLILIGIFTFSQPIFANILGIDPKLGPVVGIIMAILCVLIPIEVGWLLYEGKKRNGKWSLEGIINYTETNPIWQYFVFVLILLVYSAILFILIAPIIQPFFVDTFFAWWPEEYNFQNKLQDPSQLAGYRGALRLAIMYILVNGILGPLVEELYFRGYLLPRLEHTKEWAPILNVVLFSLYHFYSPWENLIRIVALLPLVYLVWRKKDIKFSIFLHIILNSLGGVMILMVVYS